MWCSKVLKDKEVEHCPDVRCHYLQLLQATHGLAVPTFEKLDKIFENGLAPIEVISGALLLNGRTFNAASSLQSIKIDRPLILIPKWAKVRLRDKVLVLVACHWCRSSVRGGYAPQLGVDFALQTSRSTCQSRLSKHSKPPATPPARCRPATSLPRASAPDGGSDAPPRPSCAGPAGFSLRGW